MPGFTAEAGSSFKAEIIPCPNDCDSTLKSAKINNKQISLNTSNFEFEQDSMDNNLSLELPQELSIFPNPVDEELNIIFSNNTAGYCSIYIYNINGTLLKNIKGYYPMGQVELVLNTSTFEPNAYVIFVNANNIVYKQKFIKQ